MSEDNERLIRWLTGFVFALAIIGMLCGLGIRVYGLFQFAALVPEYTVQTYEFIGTVLIFLSMAAAALWAFFIALFQARSGESSNANRRKPSLVISAIVVALAVGNLFRIVTGNWVWTGVFALAILLLSLGIGMLWRERSA